MQRLIKRLSVQDTLKLGERASFGLAVPERDESHCGPTPSMLITAVSGRAVETAI